MRPGCGGLEDTLRADCGGGGGEGLARCSVGIARGQRAAHILLAVEEFGHVVAGKGAERVETGRKLTFGSSCRSSLFLNLSCDKGLERVAFSAVQGPFACECGGSRHRLRKQPSAGGRHTMAASQVIQVRGWKPLTLDF